MCRSIMRLLSRRTTLFWALIVWAIATNCLAAGASSVTVAANNALGSKSANEGKIAAALNGQTELDFADQPLSDVVDYLRQRHEIEIQLDHKALTDAGVGSDTPITRTIKGITLESALDLMFSQLDLAWVIHDEVLLITSKAQAAKMIETRVYPVRDLLTGAAGGLPGANESDYDSLIECLAEAAALEDGSPDPRSIRLYRPAGALVITRPILVHYRIEKLLRELRKAGALQLQR